MLLGTSKPVLDVLFADHVLLVAYHIIIRVANRYQPTPATETANNVLSDPDRNPPLEVCMA